MAAAATDAHYPSAIAVRSGRGAYRRRCVGRLRVRRVSALKHGHMLLELQVSDALASCRLPLLPLHIVGFLQCLVRLLPAMDKV